MSTLIEDVKPSAVEKVTRKETWPWLVSYLLGLISLLGSIATGMGGLRYLSGTSQALAWFHISVFLTIFFTMVGTAIQIHSELRAVKSQLTGVRGTEKTLRAELANFKQVADNLRSDVRCEYVGDDEEAVRYLMTRCKLESLHAIRGTLVRSDETQRQYASETYSAIAESLTEFLKRPDTTLEEIVDPKVDKRLVDAYINAAVKAQRETSNQVIWHKLRDETPILSFVILTYKEKSGTEKRHEVLFGGSRQSSESAEAVFKSGDPRVVKEFLDLYEVLRHASERTQAKALHEPSNRSAVLHQTWDQERFFKLLNRVEPGDVNQEHEGDGDLRITTTFFISYFDLRKKALLELCAKGVRIKVLLMNPDNAELMQARFGLRKDGLTPDKAKPDLEAEIGRLADFPSIEVRISDSMPCGFVAHSRNWAIVGLMPAHDSYVFGPMIETSAGTPTWQMLGEDWKARWEAARPYRVSKAVGV